MRFVALLRGINVGGKHALAMKDLVAIFERAGAAEVATYIQSGNVVFTASAALARRLPAAVTRAIERGHGFGAEVVVRSQRELAAVARANPFALAGADPRALHVAFLAAPPAATRLAGLDTDRSPPDRFAVGDQALYLHCPGGLGRSKLTCAYFDRALATTTTMRNWTTVQRLVELASA